MILLYKSLHNYDYDKHRQYEFKIRFQTARNTGTLSGIGLVNIIIKAPAPFRNTEQQIDQRTEWEQKITYQEVLTV